MDCGSLGERGGDRFVIAAKRGRGFREMEEEGIALKREMRQGSISIQEAADSPGPEEARQESVQIGDGKQALQYRFEKSKNLGPATSLGRWDRRDKEGARRGKKNTKK